MHAMIEHTSYMAHGYCLLWEPWLVALWAGSDLLIFLSYLALPIALIVFLQKRPDIRYRGLVMLFAAFILLCGLTHFLSIVTLWYPIYPIVGMVKLATGIASATTAIVLFRLIPRLVAIPSPHRLQEVVAGLETEAAAHERTTHMLRESQAGLEAQVLDRTAQLKEANERLSVLAGEALHRGRNLLTIVQSIARQTARSALSLDGFMTAFSGRLEALAKASSSIRTGPLAGSAELLDVVEQQLEPVIATYGTRVRISGPQVALSMEAAQQFGLAVHELSTNAVKHGALSNDGGTVGIEWERGGESGGDLVFRWTEAGAPPLETDDDPATARGFGLRLLTQAVPNALQGEMERVMETDGLRYVLRAPLRAIRPDRQIFADDLSPAHPAALPATS